jgi:alcohol dehydrogenase class IV
MGTVALAVSSSALAVMESGLPLGIIPMGTANDLARTLDLAPSAEQAGDFDAVLAWVLAFRAKLAIPPALAALGLDAARADEIGAMAAVDPSAGGNPCPLDATDYAEIYRAAIAGKI